MSCVWLRAERIVFVVRPERKGNTLSVVHGNSEHLDNVDRCKYAANNNNNNEGTYC